MVDDNSNLEQLKFLEEHLDKLPKKIRAKIRLVRRKIHNGIVPFGWRAPSVAPVIDLVAFMWRHMRTPLLPILLYSHADARSGALGAVWYSTS